MNRYIKKDNKGFSLVELIVVVLIIGILGVALAPNIMKWVNNARKNSDDNNKASIESSVNAAVADFLSNPGNSIGDDVIFTIDGEVPDSWATDTTEWVSGQLADFKDCITDVFNSKYPTTQEVSGGFNVTVTDEGEVIVVRTVDLPSTPEPPEGS